MVTNEKGFTLPLTLSILIAFILFLSLQVEQLLTDRKMFQETKSIFQQEYYMLSSIKKIEKKLSSGELLPSKGKMAYLDGNMDYQIDLPSGNTQKITLTLVLNSGGSAWGYGYYDKNAKKIIKWVEKN
jgi:hypothetical protein